jgi:pyruvate,orthophosphate dikinase
MRVPADVQRQGGTTMTKWVYSFGDGKADGSAAMRNLLGGKGANLAEMSSLGLPVPPGFTISTEICTYIMTMASSFPGRAARRPLPRWRCWKRTGQSFGDPADPLLVSVRSGARVSMPGMMDTVLNLGLNDTTVEGLAKKSAIRALPMTAIAASSRCIQRCGFGGLDHGAFEEILENAKEEKGFRLDTELTAEALAGGR